MVRPWQLSSMLWGAGGSVFSSGSDPLASRPAPPCAAPRRPVRNISGFWVRQISKGFRLLVPPKNRPGGFVLFNLRGKMDGCLLGAPAPPRPAASCSPPLCAAPPFCPWYVPVLDSTNSVYIKRNTFLPSKKHLFSALEIYKTINRALGAPLHRLRPIPPRPTSDRPAPFGLVPPRPAVLGSPRSACGVSGFWV